MPANKNALLRYKTIDNCLRNTGRRWTLDDLVRACSDALYEYTGKDEYLSVRTIQLDIQKMRSDELGYNAPIVVRDRKYYVYDDPDYSITNTPLTESDLRQMGDAVEVLKQLSGFSGFAGMEDIVGRLEDHVCTVRHQRKPAIYFESNDRLRGLQFITPIYNAIIGRYPLKIRYQSFNTFRPSTIILSPYILKEYRNRWFVFGRRDKVDHIINPALDRILSVNKADGETFIEDDGFSPEEYFCNMIGVTKIPGKNDREITVRFWANARNTPYIETKPVHSSQMVVERKEDGSAIFQINVCHNFELEKVMLEFGEDIKVLSPKSLVTQIRKRLKLAAAQYE